MFIQFSIKFVLRPNCTNTGIISKRKKNETPPPGHVYLRFIQSRRPQYASTGIFVPKGTWHGEMPNWVLNGKNFNGNRINLALNTLYNKADSIRIACIENEETIDFKEFKSRLWPKSAGDNTLHNVMELIEKRKTAKGREDVTIKKDWSDYKQFLVFLYNKDRSKKREFIMKRRKHVQELIDFGASYNARNLKEELIEEYETYLRTVEENADSTIFKKLNIIRQISNSAFRKGWIAKNPFDEYEMRTGMSNPVYNTVEEMDALYKLWKHGIIKTNRPGLHGALRRYLVRFFTGQHYSDSINMQKQEMVETYGRLSFERKRQKGKKPYFVPLLKAGQDVILEGLSKDRESVILPISNQKENEAIKELMKMIGCQKIISCKAARHSFASMLYDFKVGEATVGRMIGHSRRKTMTQHYIHISKKFLVDEISRVENELNQLNFFQ